MEIRIRVKTVAYGFGKINFLHEGIIKLREIILPYFENIILGNDVKVIEYYYFINYYKLPEMIFYPNTGVYKCRYLKKIKEIRVDLCYDNIIEPSNDKDAFIIIKELFIKATEQIYNKCKNKKLDFNVELVSDLINNALRNIN